MRDAFNFGQSHRGTQLFGPGRGSSRSFSSMRGGTFVVPSLRDGSGKFDDFKRCSNANCRRGRWVRHRDINQTPRQLPDLPPRPLTGGRRHTHGYRLTHARFLGGLPYCTVCVQSLSAADRERQEEQNNELRAHATEVQRYGPANGRHRSHFPRLPDVEHADMEEQLYMALRWGCRHQPHDQRHVMRCCHRRYCPCLQMFRWNGIAHLDRTWAFRTRAMRVGYEVVDAPTNAFQWSLADCLSTVEVVPDNLRFVVVALWEAWGRSSKTKLRLGHICSVETAKRIQADGLILAQNPRDAEDNVTQAGSPRCFFVDFNDCVSILKGIESLWKHIKGKLSFRP